MIINPVVIILTVVLQGDMSGISANETDFSICGDGGTKYNRT